MMSDENAPALVPVRPVEPPSRQWWRFLQREDWLVVGWVFAIKILLFIFGAKSFRILENRPLPGRFGSLDIWNRWDSLHYLRVAQFGYNPAGVMKAWFYPLFPWCARLVAYVLNNNNYLVSAFILSGFASVAAAILLRRIVQFDRHNWRKSRVANQEIQMFRVNSIMLCSPSLPSCGGEDDVA